VQASVLSYELVIDALAYGGNGVGRHQGKAVFLPWTLPGDRISWRPLKERKNYFEGEVVSLLAAGPGRCEPRCPLFGRCGGCQWQHVTYAQQLSWKQRFLQDALTRHAGLVDPNVIPTTGSEPPWNYRNRVQFKCQATQAGVVIGFYRRGSHHVINVEQCPIAHPGINAALDFLRELVASAPTPDRIPQLDVGVGDDDSVRVVIHCIGPVAADWLTSISASARQRQYGLFLQQGRKSVLRRLAGQTDLQLRVDQPPLILNYGPGGFAQVNSEQNRKLVQAVVEAAALRGGEEVLELFCGMGNFSLALARRCRRLVGVEDFPVSIEKARANAALNGISNVSFAVADAAAYLSRRQQPFDLVVLDPPRTGASREVVQSLLQLAPKRIVYVSCDPMTLARDLGPLLGHGYQLLRSHPFDLFPQTYHLESVTLLERS
jgi:23S rRNA (uracil1939-C5)-methyltransferase